jgi:FtsP/CotA-like multicopper oxidase with cupredoxin domain
MLYRSAVVLVSLTTSLAIGMGPMRARLAPEVIRPNDNRAAAGSQSDRELMIHLEARNGKWYPEGESGVGVETAAFAEVGKPLSTPGPLIRVTTGTKVHAMIHNTLSKPLTVYGFGTTRGVGKPNFVIKPGAAREVTFIAGTPGTYYYAGQTVPGPIQARLNEDSQLNGVIVVDPPNVAKKDRIFVISWWFVEDTTSPSGLGRGTMTINGQSWPHTERLDMAQDDTAHWRVVNLTSIDHPMHLHGFYYRIDAKGDGVRDTLLAKDAQRMTVTEIMGPGQTMSMTWAPTRAGNWIFHCHFAGHLSHHVSMETEKGVAKPENDAHHMSDAPHQMYGLVMGIRVSATRQVSQAGTAPKPYRIIVREKDKVYGTHPGYAFVLGGTPAEKDPIALPVPGPALVLDRGQPVAVTIVNQSRDRAAIHWHGIELDSYPDGVPGWSGAGKDVLPSVAPGDSITVRFTPPRAGTFMYHSHFNEFQQITSGLYGALIVKEPGETLNPTTDRTLIFSDQGPTTNVINGPFPAMMMNGEAAPKPMELTAGTKYKFRVIGITGDVPIMFSLANGKTPVSWRAVARDGMTLPTSQATMQKAQLVFDPGQIYDYEFTPAKAGNLTITYGIPPFAAPKGYKPTTVKVNVSN